MRSWRHIIFFLLCLQAYAGVAGQEVRGLTENPVIKEYLRHRPAVLKSAKAADTLNLPFFEDFSTSSVVPDPSKWTDASVFVNNSFGLDPISIGVATLDAIDANGELYSTNNLPVSSDKLTSLPFDLSQYRISKEPVTGRKFNRYPILSARPDSASVSGIRPAYRLTKLREVMVL
jgi:hypothetical protein